MARFAPFETGPVLAVAVSGGRDSLCLAVLAHEWASAHGGRILALIVDHGLREAAAREAAATVDQLHAHGIASEVLKWRGLKPGSGIQEAARDARYRLLLEACQRHGILHLLLGHHAGDQAETVTMRAARGSGLDGLAGMAAVVERPEARLLRPLLGVPRSRLTATLRERRIDWIDDPSNVDPRFERARLRQAAGPKEPVAPTDGRGARDAQLAVAAVETVECDPDAGIALDWAGFRRLDLILGARLLSRLVQALGGRDHPPRRDRLNRAVGRLCDAASRGKSGKSQDFTLSGCRLMLRQAPGTKRLRWIVRPENGRTDGRKVGQPLVPAAFFACDRASAPHVN